MRDENRKLVTDTNLLSTEELRRYLIELEVTVRRENEIHELRKEKHRFREMIRRCAPAREDQET